MDKQNEIDCLKEQCRLYQQDLNKQSTIIGNLKKELEDVRQQKSDDINKMWGSLLKVQQVYSNRCKELEREINRLRGR